MFSWTWSRGPMVTLTAKRRRNLPCWWDPLYAYAMICKYDSYWVIPELEGILNFHYQKDSIFLEFAQNYTHNLGIPMSSLPLQQKNDYLEGNYQWKILVKVFENFHSEIAYYFHWKVLHRHSRQQSLRLPTANTCQFTKPKAGCYWISR